ncbi:MAG: AGE family epimerase/isomerase [Ferruginibacter sp.]
MMEEAIINFRKELEQELQRILSYWIENVQDKTHGGFYGKIDHNNTVFENAPKGSVLNSRILWAFSAAYNFTKKPVYKTIAERAFDYILKYFIDEEFGGVYWTVKFDGTPDDTKKQTYALAFTIYGLSEYYKCSRNEGAKTVAIKLYNTILQNTYDEKWGGYFEAFARDWSDLEDLRLSAKDANEKKSMNTHLHVIEAFANLYLIWPDADLKIKIEDLLHLFKEHIINKKNNHLILFFEEDWTVKSDMISYGHDIEAAWLLQEAAEIIKEEKSVEEFKQLAVSMTDAATEGLDKDGGLWYEYESETAHLIKEKHSWPQAEAMVGFFNVWQISKEEKYLQYALNNWAFTEKNITDKRGGEWVWGVNEDYSVMLQEDKAGIWKCPYHNSRGCIEIIKRIDQYLHQNK